MALGSEGVDAAVWKRWLQKYARNPNFLDYDDFSSLVLKRSKTIKKLGPSFFEKRTESN